jgi:hypothetical protein
MDLNEVREDEIRLAMELNELSEDEIRYATAIVVETRSEPEKNRKKGRQEAQNERCGSASESLSQSRVDDRPTSTAFETGKNPHTNICLSALFSRGLNINWKNCR